MRNLLAVDKVLWIKQGSGIAATGRIPEDAEFFKDHFPGFPVLPGVLALEMLKQSAECYFRSEEGNRTKAFLLKKVRGVKFSNFLRPGDVWESQLELVSENATESDWKGRLLHQGKPAVSARFTLAST